MKDIQIEEKYRRQAEKLHRENPAVDAHLDLAGEVLIRRQLGERDIVRHHYLDDWKRGGFSLIVSSVFVENRNLSNGFENALQQIDALKKLKESDCRKKDRHSTLYGRTGGDR